ncbi:MAG: hypothetical protein A3F72_02720 [Bacteroidetes bacterium RIFCSPLOWO2_12_FULL_35_15]|nr:MAG: hypothetical protein A3F72_02720 [Bacteroidetes bacterium RIFCSPLOWO2_12_FULL_35_15]
MAKTDFKKVSIKQGRELRVVNEKPVKYITVKTHNNKSFGISWDNNYNEFCITASGTLDDIIVEQNALYFKIKR